MQSRLMASRSTRCDIHIKIRGAPLLEEDNLNSHRKMVSEKLSVTELMAEDIVSVPEVVQVGGRPTGPTKRPSPLEAPRINQRSPSPKFALADPRTVTSRQGAGARAR